MGADALRSGADSLGVTNTGGLSAFTPSSQPATEGANIPELAAFKAQFSLVDHGTTVETRQKNFLLADHVAAVNQFEIIDDLGRSQGNFSESSGVWNAGGHINNWEPNLNDARETFNTEVARSVFNQLADHWDPATVDYITNNRGNLSAEAFSSLLMSVNDPANDHHTVETEEPIEGSVISQITLTPEELAPLIVNSNWVNALSAGNSIQHATMESTLVEPSGSVSVTAGDVFTAELLKRDPVSRREIGTLNHQWGD